MLMGLKNDSTASYILCGGIQHFRLHINHYKVATLFLKTRAYVMK